MARRVASSTSGRPHTLRRYTNLPAAIDLLTRKQLTLLSPSRWDDQNDAYAVELYREKRNLASVLAICFTEAEETYHHWRVFSHGGDGVCFEFDKDALTAQLSGVKGVRLGSVDYRTIEKLSADDLDVKELPFLKRAPYADECEFRILYESGEPDLEAKGFAIDLSCIRRINISPWMHESVSNSVKALLRTIDGCADIRFNRSQLVNYERWKTSISRKFED